MIRAIDSDIDLLKDIVDELCIRGNLEACGEIVMEHKGIEIND